MEDCFSSVKQLYSKAKKKCEDAAEWVLTRGFHYRGSMIDVKVILRILLSFFFNAIYPLFDVGTDIIVAVGLYFAETIVQQFKESLEDKNLGKELKAVLEIHNNHYTSTAVILVLVNPIIAIFLSTIRRVIEEWKQSKSFWSIRTLITELPVITGFCKLPTITTHFVKLRQFEIRLEKEDDKQSENARRLRELLRKGNNKILNWQVDCTITEFFYEAAPSMIIMVGYYLSIGLLPYDFAKSLLTSTLTSFMTSGKTFLAQKSELPPVLSHRIMVSLPVGFMTISKILSVAVLINFVSLTTGVPYTVVFITCYIGHCTILAIARSGKGGYLDGLVAFSFLPSLHSKKGFKKTNLMSFTAHFLLHVLLAIMITSGATTLQCNANSVCFSNAFTI